jgi:5,5'-dehydrodivanillate O-demethylase oxygenase subunit
MLSQQANDRLTRIGPGTEMGAYLRRYWHPISAVSAFDEQAIKPVRLVGEDLVLYKDLSGGFGLIDRHCPHRRSDLSYGYVEACGLRCNYHGWLFDADGRCIEQPYEDIAVPQLRFKDKIHIRSYPVAIKGGLIWAYLGPAPAPLLPDWEPFGWQNGFVQIVLSEVPCNWLQAQENSIDPVHFEWMHSNWSVRQSGRIGPYAPKHLKVEFEEFEFGIVYKRIREDTDETSDLWTIGRVALWPNGFYLGDHFEWRVPIDDENILSVTWAFTRVPTESEPYQQNHIPSWWGPIKGEDGRWIASHVMNQDFVAWVGQGTIADRTQEHLGQSDKGVSLMRRRFLAELDAVKAGAEPKALIRDPNRNHSVALPCANRDFYVKGRARADMLARPAVTSQLGDYIFQAGQPKAVREAYLAAMGVSESDLAKGAEVRNV